MNQSEPNTPEEFWRKAFEEAAETPPPRVWDAIEHRLDRSAGPRIVPLWGMGGASARSVVWGVGLAAAVALLLVGGWLIRSQTFDSSVARGPQSRPSASVANAPDQPANAPANRVENEAFVAAASRPSSVAARPSVGNSAERLSRTIANPSVGELLSQTSLPITVKEKTTDLRPTIISAAGQFTPLAGQIADNLTASDYLTDLNSNESISGLTLRVEPVAARSIQLREPAPIGRIVWFRPAESASDVAQPEVVTTKRKRREFWASVGVMPGAFNPAVTVRSAQPGTANIYAQTGSNANPPTVSSRADFSVAYQVGAGVQLSERWSLESGVGYLAGHSTVESPTAATVAFTPMAYADQKSGGGNLYVDALRSRSRQSSVNDPMQANTTTSFANGNYVAPANYDNRTRQTLTNDYQFVQVPVQAGYQMRPRKRLGLVLLGGFLTNIFVRNTVGDAVVITTKDDVYRPVSLAANVGARVRYRPSNQWSVSLAGVYQPSLSAATRPDSQVQSHPTATGVRLEADYHF